MTLKDVDNLEGVSDIAKKDDVSLEWKTANVVAQFGACPAQNAWQSGKVMALCAKLCDELKTRIEAAADSRNVIQYFDEVGFDRL